MQAQASEQAADGVGHIALLVGAVRQHKPCLEKAGLQLHLHQRCRNGVGAMCVQVRGEWSKAQRACLTAAWSLGTASPSDPGCDRQVHSASTKSSSGWRGPSVGPPGLPRRLPSHGLLQRLLCMSVSASGCLGMPCVCKLCAYLTSASTCCVACLSSEGASPVAPNRCLRRCRAYSSVAESVKVHASSNNVMASAFERCRSNHAWRIKIPTLHSHLRHSSRGAPARPAQLTPTLDAFDG